MLAKRIIPCLDVQEGQVVKGVRFRNLQIVGGILELSARYREQGADELVFYDITASPQGRLGGIRSVADAELVLNAGAEKISVNTPALTDPDLIDRLAARFGSQCVVVGIDSETTKSGYRVFCNTGDPDRSSNTGRETLAWVKEVQERGAGEIVLNCMASDGVRKGYDIVQLRAVRALCHVPLVASGGAGSAQDFREVFAEAGVDAALAASVFHNGTVIIQDLKKYLKNTDIEVRT